MPKGSSCGTGIQIAADIVVSDLSVELTLEAMGKDYVPAGSGQRRRS